MDLKETYNQIAEDWHKDHQRDDWWMPGTDKFISLFKKGDLILDVGCGAGTKSKYLIAGGLQVVGIDFSEKMIGICKREVPSGNFSVLDLSDIDKLDYLFDGIFMQAVLLHIPKQEAAKVIKNVLTKLKDGGYLYVAVKAQKAQGVEEEIKSENNYGYSYNRFFSYFTSSEIEQYLKAAGLEIIFSEVKQFGSIDWIQMIGKK